MIAPVDPPLDQPFPPGLVFGKLKQEIEMYWLITDPLSTLTFLIVMHTNSQHGGRGNAAAFYALL